MNHYPRHVGDIISATVGLSLMERGAYSALLDQYYLTEKPLPLDRSEVYRMAACTSAAERKAVDYVIARYFVEQPDGFHQKRCDEELQLYRERSASASASASARWSKRNANAMRTHSEGNANHKPVTSNQEEPTPKPPAQAPDGVRPETWDAWRRAKGKSLTKDAIRLQTSQLREWAAAGMDPNAVVEQSIRNGWKGLFPLDRPAVPTKTDARAAVLAGHFKDHDERPRDITAEVKRIA